VGFVLPVANTEAMLVHLKHSSAKIPKGRHAVIVVDKAAWQATKRLKKVNNIRPCVPLPSASPELNPTEQVWQALRDQYLANRY